MSKGGGDTATSTTTLPPELLEMIKKNYALAERVSQVGYVPYQGLTVAALSPQMEAGMRGVNSAAGAFGLPNSGSDLGLPAPTTNEAGFRGYSPFAQYEAEIAKIPQGQRDALNSFVIDPMAGGAGGYAGSGTGASAQDTYGTAEYFAHQNDTTRTDKNYLDWLAAQDGYARATSASHAAGYGGYGGYGSGGELAETPGYGVAGNPSEFGRVGRGMDAIGRAIGDAISGITGESVGANAGTTSAGGAAAAANAGFGEGDFGGY